MNSPEFDKTKAEPDIIDNRGHIMADVLNTNLGRIGFLDVSSGYFDVDGYGTVRDALDSAISGDSFRFRLLVGKDTLRQPSHDTFEKYLMHKDEFPPTLKSDLDNGEFDAAKIDNVAGLIAMLKRDNVQVRLGRSRFNHAKCYILGQSGAIIGSSNFTRPGLLGNDELNAGVFTTSTWIQIRQWYDRMWENAKDAKEDMLRILEQSKFGVPASPYQVYLKMLFEKYRRALIAMSERGNTVSQNLPKFQQDAVSVLLQTIDEHGGAILADSTGLGKTHIGLEVMRKKMAENKKILLIAPAQVRDTVWMGKLEDAQISARMIGIEELGGKEFDIFKYKRYDFIVIDESQNFRSRNTGRRKNLMRMLSLGMGRKQVLLMSATPVNNSLMDLYYQVSIITGGKDDHFADMGIPDLYKYLRDAANHKIDDGLEKIQLLLETIMVRRMRTFIREMYPDENLAGKPITFPKRVYRPIKYGMTNEFGNIYQNLLDTVNSLHMTPYGIETYNTALTDEERKKYAVLAHLQIILLLKRFESSIKAIMTSLDTKIRLFEYFGKLLENNCIVSPRELTRLMSRWNETEMSGNDCGEQEEKFMEELMKLPKQDAGKYNVELMKKDVKSDLRQLRGYLKSLKGVHGDDKKIKAVTDTIRKDDALGTGGRKVLVFTEYTATATYVYECLKEEFPEKNVCLITGSVKKSARPEIIRTFSPASNLLEDEMDDEPPEDETDILVSTEVISEGQNLQDCNYVVNYDLPWNPMRLVQRIGRVDRLTSVHDTVHSRECFPDEKLDELLSLMGKLMAKIGDINDTVGLGSDLLGEKAVQKNFQGTTAKRLSVLAGDGDPSDVTNQIERESDLMPAVSPFNEISSYVKNTGIMEMDGFPMGRRTGKTDKGRKVILAYVRDGTRRAFYSVIFDHVKKSVRVVDDMEAFRLAKCPGDEEPYLPMDTDAGRESFELLLKVDTAARNAIKKHSNKDKRIAAAIRKRLDKSEKAVGRMHAAVLEAAINGDLTEEDAEEAGSMLDLADLKQWGDYLDDLLDRYGTGKGVSLAIKDLKKIGKDMATRTAGETHETADPGKLVLVGALFVSGTDEKWTSPGELFHDYV